MSVGKQFQRSNRRSTSGLSSVLKDIIDGRTDGHSNIQYSTVYIYIYIYIDRCSTSGKVVSGPYPGLRVQRHVEAAHQNRL